MKELKATLYKFSELSEEAQQKVIDRERDDIQEMGIDAWASEYESSLQEFSTLFGINVRNWEVDPCSYNYQFSFKEDIYERDASDVKGKYLARFMRDIHRHVYKGKYFSTGGHYDENGNYHYKQRHSKVLFVDHDCPLTGYCGDNFILHPVYEWFKKPDYNKSLYDLVDECLDSFFKEWRDDMESCGTDEYVREEIEANEHGEMYFEDGLTQAQIAERLGTVLRSKLVKFGNQVIPRSIAVSIPAQVAAQSLLQSIGSFFLL